MTSILTGSDTHVTSVRLSCTARTLTVVDGRIEADLTTVEIAELQRAGYTDTGPLTPHVDEPVSDATPVPAPIVTGL